MVYVHDMNCLTANLSFIWNRLIWEVWKPQKCRSTNLFCCFHQKIIFQLNVEKVLFSARASERYFHCCKNILPCVWCKNIMSGWNYVAHLINRNIFFLALNQITFVLTENWSLGMCWKFVSCNVTFETQCCPALIQFILLYLRKSLLSLRWS